MFVLAIRALVMLVSLERSLRSGDFAAIHERVRKTPLGRLHAAPGVAQETCAAVDNACLWYWKQVLCLQRSAATVILLRKQGIPAEMVIGAQRMPFRAHAWVEVEGKVVNDHLYMNEMYSVLDRC